jgi:hypothetical protein
MKKRVEVILALTALTGMVLSVGLAAGNEKELPPFSFIVTQTAQGFEIRCDVGCDWKQVTYSCGGRVPCSAIVDQEGIRGTPTPEDGPSD